MAAARTRLFMQKNSFNAKICIFRNNFCSKSLLNRDRMNIFLNSSLMSARQYSIAAISWQLASKTTATKQVCKNNSLRNKRISTTKKSLMNGPCCEQCRDLSISSRVDCNSGKSAGRSTQYMQLMDVPKIFGFHPMKTLRNFFFSKLLKYYYDDEYTTLSFLKGAEQAILLVSKQISRGHFEQLKGLVAPEVLCEVQKNYERLSEDARQSIKIEAKEIIFPYIYEIGMIFNDDTNQRFVEIMVVFPYVKGIEQVTFGSSDHEPKLSDRWTDALNKNVNNFFLSNYRFVREYTKGCEDQWTINLINHFKSPQ